MKKTSIGKGLGCVSILPAAFIGFAALNDGTGPIGWRGFAEIFGWIALCAAVNLGLALLFTPAGWSKAWRYAVGLVGIVAFTMVTNWLGLGASMEAKIAFTSSLQIIGSAFVIGAAISIAYFAFAERG